MKKLTLTNASLVLVLSLTSVSNASFNLTGDVWDYDNVTQRGTFSCPVVYSNSNETNNWEVYGYPAVLTVATTMIGIGLTELEPVKKIGRGVKSVTVWTAHQAGRPFVWVGNVLKNKITDLMNNWAAQQGVHSAPSSLQ